MFALLAPFLAKKVGGIAIKWLLIAAIVIGLSGGIYLAARHAIGQFEDAIRAEVTNELTARQFEAVATAREDEAARVKVEHDVQIKQLEQDRDAAIARAAELATIRGRISNAPEVDRRRSLGPVLTTLRECLRKDSAACAGSGGADGARRSAAPAAAVPRTP